MKFVFAVAVLFAVAMGVQSSIVAGVPGLGLGINGLGVHGLGLGVNHIGLGVNGLGLGVSGLALGVPGQIWGQGAWWGAPAAVNVASGSLGGVSVAHQASLAGPLAGHGATYVAKTPGAIHNAPLAGHVNSVAAVNIAPAPGTW